MGELCVFCLRAHRATSRRRRGRARRLKRARSSSDSELHLELHRAGAALPAETGDVYDEAYIQKVIAAGGFRQYERTHLATLTATVKSKLGLPARPARRVVEYAFHAGHH